MEHPQNKVVHDIILHYSSSPSPHYSFSTILWVNLTTKQMGEGKTIQDCLHDVDKSRPLKRIQ